MSKPKKMSLFNDKHDRNTKRFLRGMEKVNAEFRKWEKKFLKPKPEAGKPHDVFTEFTTKPGSGSTTIKKQMVYVTYQGMEKLGSNQFSKHRKIEE